MALHTLTIHALHDLLTRREVSATEVVTAFLGAHRHARSETQLLPDFAGRYRTG